jgi:tRNA-binding protein
MAEVADFEKIDIRVGRIVSVELLPNAKYTTHKLVIDFSPEIGRKVSGARANAYEIAELTGRLVFGVVNLPPRQIGKLNSEVLTLGAPDKNGDCVLAQPDKDVPLGVKLY